MRKTSPELDAEDTLIRLPLDLSVMRLAKQAGEELLSKETRLDILGQSSFFSFCKESDARTPLTLLVAFWGTTSQ